MELLYAMVLLHYYSYILFNIQGVLIIPHHCSLRTFTPHVPHPNFTVAQAISCSLQGKDSPYGAASFLVSGKRQVGACDMFVPSRDDCALQAGYV